VLGRDAVDGNFVGQQIAAHPLYQGAATEPVNAA